jgi:hypothetical protein
VSFGGENMKRGNVREKERPRKQKGRKGERKGENVKRKGRINPK